MKRTVSLIIALLFCANVFAAERNDYVYLLAERIAADVGDEPFVVRVMYGEMLLASEKGAGKRKTPGKSDIRAAAVAYCNFGFSGGARNMIKWKKAESTPLEMRSGVRLYDWFFYI